MKWRICVKKCWKNRHAFHTESVPLVFPFYSKTFMLFLCSAFRSSTRSKFCWELQKCSSNSLVCGEKEHLAQFLNSQMCFHLTDKSTVFPVVWWDASMYGTVWTSRGTLLSCCLVSQSLHQPVCAYSMCPFIHCIVCVVCLIMHLK